MVPPTIWLHIFPAVQDRTHLGMARSYAGLIPTFMFGRMNHLEPHQYPQEISRNHANQQLITLLVFVKDLLGSQGTVVANVFFTAAWSKVPGFSANPLATCEMCIWHTQEYTALMVKQDKGTTWGVQIYTSTALDRTCSMPYSTANLLPLPAVHSSKLGWPLHTLRTASKSTARALASSTPCQRPEAPRVVCTVCNHRGFHGFHKSKNSEKGPPQLRNLKDGWLIR